MDTTHETNRINQRLIEDGHRLGLAHYVMCAADECRQDLAAGCETVWVHIAGADAYGVPAPVVRALLAEVAR